MEDKCMDTETESEHRLLYGQDDSSASTNDDAVSLFSTSLTKTLEKQNSVIVNSIVQQIAKSSAITPSSSVINGADPQAFEFKHEGKTIQHNFNQERLNKLSEVETLLKEGEIPKAVDLVGEQKAAFKQRNKILKKSQTYMVGTRCTSIWTIRWLMTTTMLLNFGMLLAERPENVISAPDRTDSVEAALYSRPANFFVALATRMGRRETRNSDRGGSLTPQSHSAQQSQRDRVCYYCRQPGYVVRECPFTKAQPVPVPTTAANTK